MSGVKLIIGKCITIDDHNPTAEALVIKDERIEFVGSLKEAKTYCDDNTEILDYKDKYIYPGFLESHTHGIFAGYRSIGQADLSKVYPANYDKYREIIIEYIRKNPNKDFYLAAGWAEDGTLIDHNYLDEICSNKPLIMNTVGGHTCLLNKAAMKWHGIDKAYAEKYGTSLVHVDENGEPNGYICEEPVIKLLAELPMSLQDAKSYILDWQQYIFSKGFTGVTDAGSDLFYKQANEAYSQLEKENKLRLRTFSYQISKENPDDPKAEVENIVKQQKEYSSEHYQIIGIKAFLDGVVESRTGWLASDYEDQPGYHGNERFNDPQKMTELIIEASKHNMPVHVHSEGDGATHFMLDCIEAAQKVTKDYDQRNILAHLHFVLPEDFKRMKETNSLAAVAPLWTPKFVGVYDNEVKYVGEQKAMSGYPIKSFLDNDVKIVFHSDYPISSPIDIPRNVYAALYRAVLEESFGGMATQRNVKESISRMDSLKAMTINIAYQWKKENELGSLQKEKLADITVFDCNFLVDDLKSIIYEQPFATIVGGEIVYTRN